MSTVLWKIAQRKLAQGKIPRGYLRLIKYLTSSITITTVMTVTVVLTGFSNSFVNNWPALIICFLRFFDPFYYSTKNVICKSISFYRGVWIRSIWRTVFPDTGRKTVLPVKESHCPVSGGSGYWDGRHLPGIWIAQSGKVWKYGIESKGYWQSREIRYMLRCMSPRAPWSVRTPH